MRLADFESRLWLLTLVIYVSQGGLLPFGSFLTQFIILFLLAVGVLNIFRLVVLGLHPGEFSLLVLGVYVFTSSALSWTGGLLQFDISKNFLVVCMTYFSASYYFRTGVISARQLQWFWILGIILAIPLYYNYQDILVNQLGRDSVTNNIGYLFLALYPLILTSERSYKKFIGILIVSFFVFHSLKRGAIFLFVVITMIYGLNSHRATINHNLRLYAKRIALLVLPLGVYYVLSIKRLNLALFANLFARFDEQAGARPANYIALINYISSDIGAYRTLFGNGSAATASITPEKALAHNDWLEIVVDFGLIGLMLYALWFVANVRLLQPFSISRNPTAVIVTLSWAMLSVYSMWFNSHITAIYMLSIACLQSKQYG